MPHTLIVLPDDTEKPFLDALAGAKKSLRIRMFVFNDHALIQAVAAARKRGVDVRVMLNPSRRSGEEDNTAVRKALQEAGVAVKDSNPAFDLTHQKSMVIDDKVGFVESLNWEEREFDGTRDYAIVTDEADEVAEMGRCFDADWTRGTFTAPASSRLIWCPNNGRERIAEFVDGAKESLLIQNERYQDTVIVERLVRAARRGVKLHILAKPPHTLKKDKLVEGVGALRILHDVGAKVHKIKKLRLHAKMLLADNKRAIVGSINLTPGSFDSRRELAIETAEASVLDRLHPTAHHDWKHSVPLDLTDEGLLADLAKRNQEAAASEKLAIKVPKTADED
ncbi:MAG: phospholipase [Proteobacteria bacterium]|nr:phospholipase [Pseudomonadota bacterium]